MIYRLIFYCILFLFPASVLAQTAPMRFQRLTYNDGLSDNKVNCILKSREGYLWIGTPMGLNRYDGFRVQSFYNEPGNKSSLLDNAVLGIVEDGDGQLWIDTPLGYCISNPNTDVVDRDVDGWMKKRGMSGHALRVAGDRLCNLWILTTSGKLYYYDFGKRSKTVKHLPKSVGASMVSDMSVNGNKVHIILYNGTVVSDGRVDQSISKQTGYQRSDYRIYADSYGGLWAWSQVGTFHYSAKSHSWKKLQGFVTSDVVEDIEHHFLIATDHGGLLVTDEEGNVQQRIVNNPVDAMSLPDNTLQCVYIDNAGVVWIGMYRMGLVHYYKGQNLFDLLPLGDVCTMTQALDGSLWLGTNDAGLKHYDFNSGMVDNIRKQTNGLGTDVVVSSLTARDGSLWFGSFQGGLVKIKDGTYKVYKKSIKGLAKDDVWSLAELPDGRIVIATLGGGVQLLNPKTDKFVTFNSHNSKLPTNFISSVTVLKGGWIAVAYSQGVSFLRYSDGNVVNLNQQLKNRGEKNTSLSINQIYYDSRGLLWIAMGTGVDVYDVAAKQLYAVGLQGMRVHTEVNAVSEDKCGTIWLSTGDEVKSVSVKRGSKGWKFFSNTYGSIDGIQSRLFNKRSILCLRDGRMLMGGIDGVNVIQPWRLRNRHPLEKVLFSGITLFDHPVGVGDTINGHVILATELNSSRELSLRHDENTFAVQLASATPGLPECPRFLYRLRGRGDDWLITSAYEPQVQFTNLSPGHYTLEVRSVDDNGNALNDITTLKITIRPPFYLSAWALLIYIAIIGACVWYAYWRLRKNQRDEMDRLKLKKEKELEEMKLVFFTNLGHELRTPLTLIISPLENIIGQVTDERLSLKLRLIQRNAHKLLALVNQMLDVRRLMRGKETLNLTKNDIVKDIKEICNQFAELSDKGITLTFLTEKDKIEMSYDKDKVGKIISNLLSNAYKFTPKKGHIEVSLLLREDKWLDVKVVDNGPGVSDEDKEHLFERFYQGDVKKRSGGSGIGLNLAWEYAKMHDGSISVADNVSGGAVFTLTLPVDLQSTIVDKPNDDKNGENDNVSVTSFTHSHSLVASSQSNDEKQTGKATILIVDDNDDFISFLTSELSPYYYIRTASDGQQALDSISKAAPNLVLTDVMMPVMDGNELCKRIKNDEKLKHIPVVMLTARLTDENEIESRECGADDYVKKPFSMQLLRMRIDSLLSKERITDDGKLKPRIAQPKITSEDEKFVDKTTSYVESHLNDAELSVEQMAQDLGMSRVQLYRRLVTVVGKTPSEFIRLIRLRHAQRLLMESQLTISEIAYRVGFSSQRYFSKCFKELYGYLPTEYKRKKSK